MTIVLRLFVLSLFCCSIGAVPGEEILLNYEFERAGDFEGWKPNNQIEGCAVGGGTLSGVSVGVDPILVSPLFDFPARPSQFVEIRMRCDAAGKMQIFWTNTTKGKYGGFSPRMVSTVVVRGDGRFHTYRVFPFWHPLGRIIHMRVDPPNNGKFEIDWIRIGELKIEPSASVAQFEFGGKTAPWLAIQDVEVDLRGERLFLKTTGENPILLSPRIDISADENFFISLRMSVDKGTSGRVYFVSSERCGLHSANFPIVADGKPHTYNIDVGVERDWEGRIIFIGVSPTKAISATAEIEWVRVGREPQGQPEISIGYFGSSCAVSRAGRAVEVECLIENRGGTPAKGLTAKLVAPEGLALLGESVAKKPRLDGLDFFSASWRLKAQEAGDARLMVEVSGENFPSVRRECTIRFAPPLNLPRADYVPPPKPVRSDYLVGVYYFPGWYNLSRWQPIMRYPERKPALGWYREGSPEVADWQIKWMLEHGISFIAYDWYWCQGARHLEHALHDGFFKAKYSDMIKFCLLWANHNPPNTSSEEDLLNVTKFWIDNYFKRPNYLKLDGRPVIIIFSPWRLTSDMGSEAVRRAFDRMDALCRKHGIGEIYMVACTRADARTIQRLKEEGYDAISGYNYPGVAARKGDWLDYTRMIQVHSEIWERAAALGILPEIPALSPGWDARPWHGSRAIVYTNNTPERFKQHLLRARDFLDRNPPHPKHEICIIEAWNEFGEGSFIEPHAKYGFGQLDAIRQVFADAPREHIDLVPEDVGLGSYDCPSRLSVTAWDFDKEGDFEDWRPNGAFKARVGDGVISGITTGRDPILSGPALRINARDYPRMRIRMSADRDTTAQIFWRVENSRMTEKTSVRFDVIGDGRMRDYIVNLAANPQWRRRITALRFDPASTAGIRLQIDDIELIKRE